MKSIEEVLEKVYSENVDNLLVNVDTEYLDYVKNGYRDYLNRQYKDEYEDYPDLDKLYNVLIGIEKSAWATMPINDKLRTFVKDDAFLELEKISISALNMAKDKLENGLVTLEEVTDDLAKSMKEYNDKVLPFNKEYASELLSEGLIDLSYACGKSLDQSFRLSSNIQSR